MSKSLTIYAPMGMLGYGFPEPSLHAALEQDPVIFAMDAGSTDPGPYYLGVGKSFTSRTMVKRDLGLLLPAARRKGVPLVIGSAGGAGGAPHLEWTVQIVREIAAEQGLHFRMAVIQAEQDRAYLHEQLERGAIFDFETGRELTAEDIDACSHIVGQMGVEPVIEALRSGAEVVVAGRAFDAALTAALPIMHGIDKGLALHMGKIVECGSLVAVPRTSDGVVAHIAEDHFLIHPADPNKRCTVDLVAAHTLYEKSDPYRLHLPGGMLDLTRAHFEAHDDRTVRVSGSRFVPAEQYTIKLEGSARVGFRTVCLAGARDPILIERFDEVIEKVRAKLRNDLASVISPDQYQVLFRLYGKDGVMGPLEPALRDADAPLPYELGLVIEVVAPSQEVADTVCALARSATLHQGYEGRLANAGNLAFPYSPAEFPAPEAYEFRVYHLMKVDDPCAPFPISYREV